MRTRMLSGLVVAFALMGCRTMPPDIPSVPLAELVGTASTTSAGPSDVAPSPAERARDACAAVEQASVYFDVDSEAVRAEDNPTLAALGWCLVRGPLRGDDVLLLGYTEPLGPERHNEQLAFERAHRVEQHLVARGVERDRIDVIPMGEVSPAAASTRLDRDRRVDILTVPNPRPRS